MKFSPLNVDFSSLNFDALDSIKVFALSLRERQIWVPL